jgi:ubiquinone biosynthesis protein
MNVRRIGLASRTYRHVNRYRQTLTVLIKYGFGGLVDRLRITQYLEIGLRLISREPRPHVETLTPAERARLALEELGPTFVKLGQVLSTRPDLIPPDFVQEFARLQQHVPPFPFEHVQRIIAHELHRPLEEVFESFTPQPLGSASIGQVHRARLRDGEEVVVKVQRPNIRSTIEVDLEILLHLATLAERHLEDLRSYRPRRIVEEFSRVLERELDYTTEAAHLERFAADFHDDDFLYVPKVYREYTTTHVLTLEYVDVVPIRDAAQLRAAGLDPCEIARRGVDLTLKQLLVHGFFHADPHPGNVFALPGNVVCLLDFGMVGRLERALRESFADLVYAVALRDAAAATVALLRLTEHDDDDEPDLGRLELDVSEFIDVNIPARVTDLKFGKLLYELLDLVQRHRLLIPPDVVMMLKAAATVERLVARLDPELNMITAARPYVQRLRLARLHPGRILRDLFATSGETLQFLRDMPGTLRDLLRMMKRGALRIGFEHRGLERLLDTHERVANRVSFAIVVAALIVGSSLIVHSKLPPTWHGIPVVGVGGYVAAGALGFLLLVSIIRHGRL